jgi:hypothetical protein
MELIQELATLASEQGYIVTMSVPFLLFDESLWANIHKLNLIIMRGINCRDYSPLLRGSNLLTENLVVSVHDDDSSQALAECLSVFRGFAYWKNEPSTFPGISGKTEFIQNDSHVLLSQIVASFSNLINMFVRITVACIYLPNMLLSKLLFDPFFFVNCLSFFVWLATNNSSSSLS